VRRDNELEPLGVPALALLVSWFLVGVLFHLCSRSEHYKLDAFFGQEDSISQLFDREVSTVIPGIFNGVNATVFAYGATGSGKTYTMQVPAILLTAMYLTK